MLKTHNNAIRKIYLVAGLSLSLLTACFYFFGIKPLSDRLHVEHSFEIDHLLDSSLWLLENILSKHFDLAQQSASRTAIRKKQAEYLSGNATLNELVAFSAPKLTDAMHANDDIVGIARYDTLGRLLFNVGDQIPAEATSRCNFSELKSIKSLDPTPVDDFRRLLYCSPIDDSDKGRVGFDILMLKENSIQKVIDFPQDADSNIMTIGLTSANKIIYWANTQNDQKAKSVLESFIDTGLIGTGYFIQSKPLTHNDWQLYAVINEDGFFADINKQLYILTGALISIAIVLFGLTVATLRPVIKTLIREQQLIELSHRDGLTGLYNHRHMQELLSNELFRAQRYKHAVSILMIDIDYFKQINDNYGHLTGDDVLHQIAQIILNSLRKQDLAARYGGEEFMLILPETDEDGATIMAERLRKDIQSKKFLVEDSDFNITISVGVACYYITKEAIDKRNIIKAADRALYASKENGRNRTTSVTLRS